MSIAKTQKTQLIEDYRLSEHDTGSPEVQAKLGPIATILSRASDMGGGLAKAVIWFRHQPIAAFGYERAVDIVHGRKAGEVLRWLDALEDGAYA